MFRDQFCEEIKSKFPEISAKAEKEYLSFWGNVGAEFYSYTWFEALARVLNAEMNKGVLPKEHNALFSAISIGFINGNEDIKKAIDVAFVENLFWEVSSSASKLYWDALPEVLKKLYLDFHRKYPY